MFFNKTSNTLKNLIPSHFVDVHNHILPGIDDGSKTPQQSLHLLNLVKKLGFEKIIATPHIMSGVWNNNVETIFNSYMNLKEAIPSETFEMVDGFAAEYFVDYEFSQKISTEKLLTFNEGYVLIEFSFLESPKIVFDIISQLKDMKYKIILAHPERYVYYHNEFYFYEELKNYDIKFQINLLSTVGYYGTKILKTADKLLENDYIDFAGSDIHHEGHIEAFSNKIQIKNKKRLVSAMENNSKLLLKEKTSTVLSMKKYN